MAKGASSIPAYETQIQQAKWYGKTKQTKKKIGILECKSAF